MRYLNLSKGFNPSKLFNNEITFESFVFNGGEPHIKIVQDFDLNEDVTITHRMNSFNDLGLICVAVDALRQMGVKGEIDLLIPYFLGARQDRVCNKGEALTCKVVANIINSLNFNQITIFDPHSDVAPALINNCVVIDNHSFVRHCLEDMEFFQEYANIPFVKKDTINPYFHLISPDAGSNKKMKDLSKTLYSNFSPFNLIKCDKTRKLSSGKLSGFEVYSNDLKGLPCVIIDDICDGGGTFIGLSEELKKKNAGDLYLIVSHGIFSKGFKDLKVFKKIYTTDSIKSSIDTGLSYNKIVKIIPLKK